MRFIIFVVDSSGNTANTDEMTTIDQFNEKLQKNGHWITAGGINGAEKSFLIDNREGRSATVEGSLVKGNENYSGFWIIEVESEEIAIQLAKEGSLACNRKVELRPFLR